MKYRVETTARFDKEFKKLDRYTQRMLKAWIEKNLMQSSNPRLMGKALTGNFKGLWRCRIECGKLRKESVELVKSR